MKNNNFIKDSLKRWENSDFEKSEFQTPPPSKGVTEDINSHFQEENSDVIFDDYLDFQPKTNGYKIDWLSFTFPFEFHTEVLEDILIKIFKYDLYNDFDDIPGRNFYNSGLTLGNYLNIFWNSPSKPILPNSSKTTNIIFTGQGMTDLSKRIDPIEALKIIINIPGVSIARIDIAFDSFFKDREVPSLDLISSKLDSKEYKSPKRSHNIIKEQDSEGVTLGHTCYIGKHTKTSQGNYFLRIYDKKAQYLYSKKAILPDIVESTGHWNRWEFVFTKKKAHSVVSSLLYDKRYKNDIDIIFKELLGLTVTFLEPKKTTKKSRWEVCPWWNDFLFSDEKYVFKRVDVDADFVSMLSWVSNSVMPTINVLSIILDKFGYDFIDILRNFNHKNSLSKKHLRAIKDVDILSQDQVNTILKDFIDGSLLKDKKDRLEIYESLQKK